ncbi:MAG: class I SAM-dependent methyltransferase [Flavobacteriales bacterium]|nr:class I SAM-dependent methyltransferase [Flavobacteriales bacterium]MEB2340874.1 class I SAM-dependent methyltransferase [Flavobacteriia bacterium]
MNLDRIYSYRFRDVDQAKRAMVWKELSAYLFRRLGQPQAVLDPAAGMCEFINHVPAGEKWAVDVNEPFVRAHAAKEVRVAIGDTRTIDLPKDHFDAVFVSNFLEHLGSQEEVADFLTKLHTHIKPGGRIAVMGPNFKYTYKEYFDFADHTVVLSELGAAEHLYGAGFEVESVEPRFLPLSFRGRLPVNRFLVRSYLARPWAWRFFGKQFLLIGRK